MGSASLNAEFKKRTWLKRNGPHFCELGIGCSCNNYYQFKIENRDQAMQPKPTGTCRKQSTIFVPLLCFTIRLRHGYN